VSCGSAPGGFRGGSGWFPGVFRVGSGLVPHRLRMVSEAAPGVFRVGSNNHIWKMIDTMISSIITYFLKSKSSHILLISTSIEV
jgi:hypothetical protein